MLHKRRNVGGLPSGDNGANFLQLVVVQRDCDFRRRHTDNHTTSARGRALIREHPHVPKADWEYDIQTCASMGEPGPVFGSIETGSLCAGTAKPVRIVGASRSGLTMGEFLKRRWRRRVGCATARVPRLSIRAVESELHSYRGIDKPQVRLGQEPDSLAEPELVHGRYLIGHRFSRLAVQTDEGLAGLNAVGPARNGYDLNSVQDPV